MADMDVRCLLRPACGLGLLLATCLGCQMPHRVVMSEDGSPVYERITVVYEAHGREGALFLPSGTGTAGDDVEGAGGTTWALAKLRIEYPDPAGDARMAQATLELSPVRGAVDEWVRQRKRRDRAKSPLYLVGHTERDEDATMVGVMKFPKQRLDLLLFDLTASGFFDRNVEHSPEAHLEVSVDKGRTSRFWSCEPRLDDFVAQTYHAGRDRSVMDGVSAVDHAPLVSVELEAEQPPLYWPTLSR